MSWFIPEPSHSQPVAGGPTDLGPFRDPIIDEPSLFPYPRVADFTDPTTFFSPDRQVDYPQSMEEERRREVPFTPYFTPRTDAIPNYDETRGEEEGRRLDETEGEMGRGGRRQPPLVELPVDIRRDKGEYTIQADLPGVRKEDVELNVEGGRLTIEAKREGREEEWMRRERGEGRMRRELALPSDVDQQGVRAQLRDGVLTVKLPRREKNENPIII